MSYPTLKLNYVTSDINTDDRLLRRTLHRSVQWLSNTSPHFNNQTYF
jgi:hypothetical protein